MKSLHTAYETPTKNFATEVSRKTSVRDVSSEIFINCLLSIDLRLEIWSYGYSSQWVLTCLQALVTGAKHAEV